MKKRIYIISLIFAFAVVFSACGAEGTSQTKGNTEQVNTSNHAGNDNEPLSLGIKAVQALSKNDLDAFYELILPGLLDNLDDQYMMDSIRSGIEKQSEWLNTKCTVDYASGKIYEVNANGYEKDIMGCLSGSEIYSMALDYLETLNYSDTPDELVVCCFNVHDEGTPDYCPIILAKMGKTWYVIGTLDLD